MRAPGSWANSSADPQTVFDLAPVASEPGLKKSGKHAADADNHAIATMAAMLSSHSLQLRLILDDVIAFGPGKASLLQSIERTGSISAAAREMGMSYRRAWLLIEDMNRCFRQPLVETATGGARGGGSSLTEAGRDVLHRYLAVERKANKLVKSDMDYLKSLMVGKPRS
jgi:molybdate transport system regulatory protein